jgi:hypothetical protein
VRLLPCQRMPFPPAPLFMADPSRLLVNIPRYLYEQQMRRCGFFAIELMDLVKRPLWSGVEGDLSSMFLCWHEPICKLREVNDSLDGVFRRFEAARCDWKITQVHPIGLIVFSSLFFSALRVALLSVQNSPLVPFRHSVEYYLHRNKATAWSSRMCVN